MARLRGTQLSEEDKAAAEANRAAVKQMQDVHQQRRAERGDMSDASDDVMRQASRGELVSKDT